MENLYTNYKNIVDRAILSGIITEESRNFYLSAIEEEDGSELSELESRLNQEEETNASLKYKQKIGSNDTQGSSYENENKNEAIENLSLNNDDSQSILEGTIENYSILDIKLPKHNDFIEETDSDSFSTRQGNMDSRSIEESESATLAKVMKKPQKYQVLDFNVPIYVDIKRNKPKIKRDLSNCGISTKKDPSYDKKKKNSEVLEKDYKESLNNMMLRNAKMASIEKDNSASLKHSSDLTNPHIMFDRIYGYDEKTECVCQENKHQIKKRSVHTCSKSVRKEYSEPSKDNAKVFLDGRKVPKEKFCQHCSKEPVINAKRPFKIPLNHERKYKMKLTRPVASKVQQNTFKETVNDNDVNAEENTAEWKQCKCNHVYKSTQYASNTDNNPQYICEDENLEFDVTTEKSSEKKNCDGILKVNIVCRFYQEGELKKPNDDQDKKRACSDEGPEQKIGNKVDRDHITKDKNKRRTKTQRLSKIFSHIKMRKMQKQSL